MPFPHTHDFHERRLLQNGAYFFNRILLFWIALSVSNEGASRHPSINMLENGMMGNFYKDNKL